MNRFLRYSQEKGRKIRMMLMLNGQLAQKTALVLSYDGQNAVLQLGQRKLWAERRPYQIHATQKFFCFFKTCF